MYDHYIALDWAQSNMAIARLTKESSKASVINVASSVKEIQMYLDRLKGKKILTFEEASTSQWLYVELKDYVDALLVCDPHRNRLLSEGAKTDEIDAVKLVRLLRGDFLKPVFHSLDGFIYLRKLISGYDDVVRAGVRLKNQRAGLLRCQGKDKKERELTDKNDRFVLEGLDRGIDAYEEEKTRYEEEMKRQGRKFKVIGHLDRIFGIGNIGAVKIAARVVDARRFEEKGKWLSYCGLVRQEKMSGGRSYGWRKPRCCRMLKGVFKTAALSVITMKSQNCFYHYYRYLLDKKHYSEHNARHAVARKIAVIALAVMKSGKPFDAKRLEKVFQK